MTDDPLRRLRQHNREIVGGARATAGRKWKHVCVLSGFPTRRSALQFEWMWKHLSRRASVVGKMETIAQIWKRDYSSSTSIHFSQFNTPFFLSFSPSWTGAMEKIESIQSLKLVKCAPRFQTDYDSFQLFPFPLISKMSSPISNVVVDAAAPAVVEEKKKVPRKPKTAAPEAEAAAPAEKPKKEKKAAAAPTSDGEAPVEKKVRKPKTSAAAAAAAEESVAAAAAAPAPEPAEASKEAKPKKVKKAAAAAAEPEPVVALPGSTAALAAGSAGGAPLMRTDGVATDAETTDAEGVAAPAPKEKKSRKPRAKKAAAAAAAPADLPVLDTATLDALDMAGKVALLKDHVLALTARLAALTTAREAVSSDDESTGKKQRKKREPKAKAVCPAAADGVIRFHTTLKNDYKALSNSHKADITIDGVVYPTVEHYYQCAKFLDTAPEYADKIRAQSNAALVKNMGRTKKETIRADWEAVQLDVMRKALRAKFTQHDDLAALLRGTGAARLEEESPSDAYWGIGADGAGMNRLGELLAEIRASL